MCPAVGLKNDRLSVLRYAGGKIWLIPRAVEFVGDRRPVFIEPFCGGASVGLTLLHRDLISSLVMCEKDARVVAFWRRALTDESFADEVENFTCNRANAEAAVADTSDASMAMWTLVKNRCSFGGILDDSGLTDFAIAKRWCSHLTGPALRRVFELRGRITLIEGDGIRALREYSDDRDCVGFADPPYSAEADGGPGKNLYREHRLDHAKLFEVLAGWEGRWLMTHSDCVAVRALVQRHSLQAQVLRMLGNNGKRTELAIGRDLSTLSCPGYLEGTSEPGIPLHEDAMQPPATTCTSDVVLKKRGCTTIVHQCPELGLSARPQNLPDAKNRKEGPHHPRLPGALLPRRPFRACGRGPRPGIIPCVHVFADVRSPKSDKTGTTGDEMASEKGKNPRGVFERPPGSGVWWINFYVDGVQRREKVGRKSDAIDLYRTRKTDARRGVKLPEVRKGKITLSALIDDVLEFVVDHRDRRSYISKAGIVRESLGSLLAADITPQDLDRWLRSRCKTAATSNRYKAFISLCYREGVRKR
jgi:site-specific DNA-adenine methylase